MTTFNLADVYQLRITLRDVEPPVWRSFEIAGSASLSRLHGVIQTVMGWYDAHLHEFRIGPTVYGEPDPEFDFGREIKDDRRVRLSRVAPRVGSSFVYFYDFGDSWEHDVVVESIHPPDGRVRYPRVVAGENACPPEDVGGPPGYERFLHAINDPDDLEHEDMRAWIGYRYDPRYFRVANVNRALRMEQRLRRPRD